MQVASSEDYRRIQSFPRQSLRDRDRTLTSESVLAHGDPKQPIPSSHVLKSSATLSRRGLPIMFPFQVKLSVFNELGRRKGQWLVFLLAAIAAFTLCSISCVIIAIQFFAASDILIDPCQNFYRYSCSWWFGGNRLYGIMTGKHDGVVLNYTRELLLGRIKSGSLENIDTAQKMYKACMDDGTIRNVGLNPLKDLLLHVHDWPLIQGPSRKFEHTIDDLAWTMGVVQSEGLSDGIFYIRVEFTAAANMAVVEQISLSDYERVHYYDSPKDKKEEKRKQSNFMLAVVEKLGGPRSDWGFVEDSIEEVIEFEDELKMHLHHGNTAKLCKVMTIQELQRLCKLNWITYLNGMFGNMKNFTWTDKLSVCHQDYARAVGQLLSRYHPTIIINYVIWNALATLAWHSEMMATVKQNKYRPRKARAMYQYWKLVSTAKSTERWEECVEAVIDCLPRTVAHAPMQHDQYKENVRAAYLLVDNIVTTLIELIHESDWLQPSTKYQLKKKALAITREIGINGWKNFVQHVDVHDKVEITNYHMKNIAQCRKADALRRREALVENHLDSREGEMPSDGVYYDNTTNSLRIFDGVLNLPFMDTTQLNAITYGVIGFLISFSILKGFDDEGQGRDYAGYPAGLWEPNDFKNFSLKADCYINQYNQHCIRNNKELDEHCDFGEVTFYDNIAVEGGIRLAYKAYNNWVKKNCPEKEWVKLVVEEYTPAQLFFVSYAMMWCSDQDPLPVKYYVDFEKRRAAPFHIRVNNPLSNLPEFSEAYDCSEKDNMNRGEEKCTLW